MLDNRTWLLIGRKMANEASAQELQELESILRSNPELHFSLQALSDLWQQPPSDDKEKLESAYKNLLARMNSNGSVVEGTIEDDNDSITELVPYPVKHRKNWLSKLTLLAAISIVIVAILIFNPFKTTKTLTQAPREVASEISTRYGSRTSIVLPDGSKVWLNAGSKIIYDKNFGERLRELKLTGEAYFDVVHNASQPFIIHIRAMDIKVLGTEFNVKSYPDDKKTETSLIRGSIEVTLKDTRAQKIIMRPNEKLIVDNNLGKGDTASKVLHKKERSLKHSSIFSLEPLNYSEVDSIVVETSWVNNRLFFEDESFEEIALKMTRWYGVNFIFKDDDIKMLRFTGNFRNETINEALAAMQITANFKFRIEDKKVTITKH